MAESDEQLKRKIQEQLVESGEYDRISTQLKQKLAESGWVDKVRRMAKDELSQESNPNFTRLNQVIEPQAMSMVPDNVRDDTLQQIKQFIEQIVDK